MENKKYKEQEVRFNGKQMEVIKTVKEVKVTKHDADILNLHARRTGKYYVPVAVKKPAAKKPAAPKKKESK